MSIVSDSFKFDRYTELPISYLDVEVLVYKLPADVRLTEDQFGDNQIDLSLLANPVYGFYANVSKLDQFVLQEGYGTKTDTMVQLIARTADTETIEVNDIIRLDLQTNQPLRIVGIKRNEYRFATIFEAYRLIGLE